MSEAATDPSGMPATPPEEGAEDTYNAGPEEGQQGTEDETPDLLGTESLEGQGIDPGPEDRGATEEGDAASDSEDGEKAKKPEWVEDKFWDAEKGEVRTEALAKSYGELQKKLSSTRPAEVPESYEIELPEGVEQLGEAEDALFRELGLNNEQAQAAFDFLHEQVIPQLSEAKASAETAELARQWDMQPKSQEMTARVTAVREWANQNLPPEVVKHMSRSAQGVQQLWVMMQSGSDVGMRGGASQNAATSTAELQSMMNDPKYWDGDEAYIAEVERKAGVRR